MTQEDWDALLESSSSEFFEYDYEKEDNPAVGSSAIERQDKTTQVTTKSAEGLSKAAEGSSTAQKRPAEEVSSSVPNKARTNAKAETKNNLGLKTKDTPILKMKVT